ncbi:hypothetical protein CROQUDRAFT_133564 [Cronartium quercuum f. sp. fusiforme G11]|uniref:Class E vacuolar protein-sorting machinery protein HSE1 n=1 Tax=Cronartium quercuum f. sp. fusiforme G11 TaxID=708437 RepID=A0A9P6TB15_9BASI|nr:hypothetical protein CROQUDRAFT_133564 [Cronartium quercuum f. sp. fusiforme G11]
MFRGTPANPYDEIVIKATDEAQTSENWSVLIEVCDKVISDKTPTGPRDCIASVQKRLQHRNANVQLFCLTLTEALVKNTNENLHKEVSSRAFMKVLSGLVQDRYTHEKVKKRILQCLKSWSDDFHGRVNLGLVEETVEELRAKGYKHEEEIEPTTHPADDVLKREEEELQRALAESEREAEWMNMVGVGKFPTTSKAESHVGPTGYIPSAVHNRISAQSSTPQPRSDQQNNAPRPTAAVQHAPALTYSAPTEAFGRISLQDESSATDDVSLHPQTGPELYPMRTISKPAPRRVKALYDFEPNDEGELAFKEGDVIRVIDSAYKDWWKGEFRGQIGIFPVNYVEPMPDPTPESLAKEAEAEAMVFAQANEIDRLLQMMRNLDAKKDNLADNDELSELYQQTLSLRPKIVRLIEKYTQKKTELLQINEKFMKAKMTYDTMIEESLAKYHPGVAADIYTQPNPNYHPPNHYPQSGYAPQSYHSQASYPYDQAGNSPYVGPPQPFQHSNSLPGVAGQSAYQAHDAPVPEGIDTSRYYLASDGNWYAYSAEQLAANASSPPQAAAPQTNLASAAPATYQQRPSHVHHQSSSFQQPTGGELSSESVRPGIGVGGFLNAGQASSQSQYGGWAGHPNQSQLPLPHSQTPPQLTPALPSQ